MSYDTLPNVKQDGRGVEMSHPEFSLGTKGTDVAQAFAETIRGKNIIITGVSPKSLGETLAVTLASHEPSRLILASRTRSKLNEVSRSVSSSSNITPDIVELDLASQRSIRAAAAKINALVSHVDILIQNAAVVSSDRHETEDGIEQTFGTNHVGHFLLTSLLMPRLIAPPRESRVINVTSLGYRLSPVRFHDYNFTGNMVPPEEQPPPELPPRLKPDPQGGRPYQGFCAYGQSKTANILHCVSLNKKYANSGLRAFAVHPGSIWTDLSRNLTPEDLKIIEGTSTTWLDQDQGTATILVAALDPKLSTVHDQVLLSDCQFLEAADTATNPTIAERLWKLSENLTIGEESRL